MSRFKRFVSAPAMSVIVAAGWSLSPTPTNAQETEPATLGAEPAPAEPEPAPAEPGGASPAAPGPAEPTPPPTAEGALQAAPSPEDGRPLPPPPPRRAAGGYGAGSEPYFGPPEDGVYRPLSFTLGAGLGFIRGNDLPDPDLVQGISYALRLGFGVQEDLLLTLGFEGSSARKDGTLGTQEAFLIGIQYFLAQVFYVRGAMGVANQVEEDATAIYMDQNGFGLQGALGLDLVQSEHVALSLEGMVLHGRYSEETWTGGGLSLLFTLY